MCIYIFFSVIGKIKKKKGLGEENNYVITNPKPDSSVKKPTTLKDLDRKLDS